MAGRVRVVRSVAAATCCMIALSIGASPVSAGSFTPSAAVSGLVIPMGGGFLAEGHRLVVGVVSATAVAGGPAFASGSVVAADGTFRVAVVPGTYWVGFWDAHGHYPLQYYREGGNTLTLAVADLVVVGEDGTQLVVVVTDGVDLPYPEPTLIPEDQYVAGGVPKAINRKSRRPVRLPNRSSAGQPIKWTSLTPRICRVRRNRLIPTGRRGTCRLRARGTAVGPYRAMRRTVKIRVR